jgi:hypothetical protein
MALKASFAKIVLKTNNQHRRSQVKVMAIGTLKPLTPEQEQTYLPKEVPATLQIYLDGKMEQFWLREKNAGVIFLMNVDSVAEADALLKGLPLGRANLLTFELMPIGPLSPLGMLIKQPPDAHQAASLRLALG